VRSLGREYNPGTHTHFGDDSLKVYLNVLTAMRQLRNYGVYRLPDGRGYVAVRGGSGKFYLFECREGLKLPPVFEVTQEGLVLRWFNSGPEWCAEHLQDTGRTFADGKKLNCPD
jgi:hypothetical protein